jgi:DNA-binding MarR family transcriptional regulator
MSTKMSKRAPQPAPPNVGILLRDPFRALVSHVHKRLAERGHPEIRPAHGNVFQFLDAQGTRVSVLAERAQVTKQSMAELVAHLEANGYVERIPDPTDRRAKLVRATPKGLDSVPIALDAIAEIEAQWTERLGEVKMRRLHKLLEELNAKL